MKTKPVRQSVLQIRLSESEKQSVNDAAIAAGMDVSAWARNALLHAAATPAQQTPVATTEPVATPSEPQEQEEPPTLADIPPRPPESEQTPTMAAYLSRPQVMTEARFAKLCDRCKRIGSPSCNPCRKAMA